MWMGLGSKKQRDVGPDKPRTAQATPAAVAALEVSIESRLGTRHAANAASSMVAITARGNAASMPL